MLWGIAQPHCAPVPGLVALAGGGSVRVTVAGDGVPVVGTLWQWSRAGGRAVVARGVLGGCRAGAVWCWHFPSSGSSELISLRLPGRGREVALEWGGLASASIFNEIDIYFSPSWLPPHRSLSHPPGLFSSPWQQGCGAGASRCWEPPGPLNPAPGVQGPCSGWVARVGRQVGGEGPLSPPEGSPASCPSHGDTAMVQLEPPSGTCWFWGQEAVFMLCWEQDGAPFGSIPPPPNLCPLARGWACSPRCSRDRRAFGEGAGGQKALLGVSPCWRCDHAQLQLLDEQEAVGLPHRQAQGITLTHGAPVVPIAWGQRWWRN